MKSVSKDFDSNATPNHKRVASIIMMGHAFKHIYNSGLLNILLPEIKIGLKLNAEQYGSLISFRQIVSWGTTIGAGYISDRFTSKTPLILGISLGLLGVSFWMAGHAKNYATILAIILLIGLSPSLFHPSAIGALSRMFPGRRGLAVSLHGTGGIIGEVLGPLIAAGALIVLEWRGVLQASLYPAIIVSVLIWWSTRHSLAKKSDILSFKSYISSLKDLLKNRVLILLIVCTALRSIGDTAVGGFLPIYLKETLSFSATRVAIYLSLAQIAGIVSQPTMGYMSDKLGPKSVLVPGMLITALLTFALSYSVSNTQLAIIVIAKGAFSFPMYHIFIAAAISATGGKVQATVTSIIYAASFLGTFSPYVAGKIIDQYDIYSVFIYGAIMAAITGILLLWFRLPRTET